MAHGHRRTGDSAHRPSTRPRGGTAIGDRSVGSLMFSIAYRMVGSASDAEDIVQEAWLRIHREAAAIESLEGFATTVTTRLAIDHLRSARVRREVYIGAWLPEPLVGPAADPAIRHEEAETLSIAFLVVLERLSPIQRAVFLLRDIFGYEYPDIAQIVGKSMSNCRQILARARTDLRARAPRFHVTPEDREALARRFFAACNDGDLAGLEEVLADDVRFHADGGGRTPAVQRPVYGRSRVARFLLGLLRRAEKSGQRVTPTPVNGQPGAIVADRHGRPVAVFALHITDGAVSAIHNVMNPGKLRHLTVTRAADHPAAHPPPHPPPAPRPTSDASAPANSGPQ